MDLRFPWRTGLSHPTDWIALENLADYLALLSKYPGFIETIRSNLKTQQDRGIILPKPEIELVRRFLAAYLKAPEQSLFHAANGRLAGIHDQAAIQDFQRKEKEIIEQRINPSLDKLIQSLQGDYAKRAPDAVGLSQYPGGAAFRFWSSFTPPSMSHQYKYTS